MSGRLRTTLLQEPATIRCRHDYLSTSQEPDDIIRCGDGRHGDPGACLTSRPAVGVRPPRLAVVPDPTARGAFALEIDGQPLVTRASAAFCLRVEHRFRNPAYADTPDAAGQLAEELRRWAMR